VEGEHQGIVERDFSPAAMHRCGHGSETAAFLDPGHRFLKACISMRRAHLRKTDAVPPQWSVLAPLHSAHRPVGLDEYIAQAPEAVLSAHSRESDA